MANETTLTIIGNLTADPELRFTPSGAAVANFTVASTPRTFDKQTNEWRDGDTLFMGCSVWRDMAEHVSESLTKGMRVVVSGRLKQRSYETKDGDKRTVVEMDVDEVGPSLRYATAIVKRVERQRGQAATWDPEAASQGRSGWGQQQQGNWDGANDPWTTGQPAQQPWGAPQQQQPPPWSQPPLHGNVVDPSQGPQPWSGPVPPGQVRNPNWDQDEPPF